MTRKTLSDCALWAALPMAHTSKVETRVIRILDSARCRTLSRKSVLVSAGLMAGLSVVIASAQPMPAASPPAPPDVDSLHYMAVDLGASWADFSDAHNYLNEAGEVFGVIRSGPIRRGASIPSQTGFWDTRQQWTPLPLNPGETRVDPASFSASGQFVGQSMNGKSEFSWIIGDRTAHVYFRYTDIYRQFKATCGDFSGIKSINDRGDLLLTASQKTRGRAFVWHDNHLTALEPLPSQKWPGVTAEALNNRGWAVGASGGHAVLWKEDTPEDLGVLPGYDGSIATEVNNFGDAAGVLYHNRDIGRSPFSGQRSRTFFWHTGTMQQIKPLPHCQYIEPKGINDAGQVVGWSFRITPLPGHTNSLSVDTAAFLWQNGITYNLQQFLPATSNLRLQCADGINSRGQIIATASSNKSGTLQVVLLTPGKRDEKP